MNPVEVPPRLAAGQEARWWYDVDLVFEPERAQPRPVVRAERAIRAPPPAPDVLDVLGLRDVENREPILLVLADRDHLVLHALRLELAVRPRIAVVEPHRIGRREDRDLFVRREREQPRALARAHVVTGEVLGRDRIEAVATAGQTRHRQLLG